MQIDTLTVSFGIHRLNGISSPANAAYSAHELAYQLKASNASALFTCAPLLSTALEAAASAGIESEKIYLIDVPEVLLGGKSISARFKTVNGLIQDGKTLPPLQPLQWTKGQGARQIAFLCFSSGTSGLPVCIRRRGYPTHALTPLAQKGVMISHRNSISNVLQNAMLEPPRADQANPPKGQGLGSVVLGLLPFSHIYGLVVIAMLTPFLGGRTIVLPKFEIKSYLKAIQDYQITTLYVVSEPASTMSSMLTGWLIKFRGAAHNRRNAAEQQTLRSVSVAEGGGSLVWCCATGQGNRRRRYEALVWLDSETGLRSVLGIADLTNLS